MCVYFFIAECARTEMSILAEICLDKIQVHVDAF
jgi:hypothetical protein